MRLSPTRLLDGLSQTITRHPWRVVMLSAGPCLLLSVAVAWVPLDLAFIGIMNPDDPLVAQFSEVNAELKLACQLPLLLEGPEEELQQAIDELVPALQALPQVDRVMADVPTDWLEARAPWLVDRELFDAWVRLATHPADSANAERLGDGLTAIEARYDSLHPPGVRLILVQMAADPMTAPVGQNGFTEIETAARQVLDGLEVEGAFAGLAAMSEQDQAQVLQKVQILTPLSLVAVLLLLLFVERRPTHLMSVAAPMLLALGGTLGLVGLIAGKITIIETFFGMLVFGLGVDFALHLIVRLREERAQGLPFAEALRSTLVGTGSGIVVGALTTAGAFLVVALAPDPVAFHLGLSGGIGLLLCLVLMLTLLPGLWTLLDRRTPASPPRPMDLPLLRPLAHLASRNPWPVLVVAVALVAGALAGSGRFHYQDDLARVFSRDVPAMETQDRIQALYGVNTYPWISSAETLQEARRLTQAFEDESAFAQVESAATVLPADLPQRAAVLAEAAPAIESQRQLLESMQAMPMGFNAGAARAALELLTALARAAELGPPGVDDLPDVVRAQLLSPSGDYLVYAYSDQPTLSATTARAQRLAAQAIDPGAASSVMAAEAMLGGDYPWMPWVLGGILLLVATVLALDLRSARWVVVALAPVLFGTSVTFGLLCWIGLDFNVMGAVVVPLIIGLGVDDGIHVVHRIREHAGPAHEAAVSVGRAIVMTTLTTCTGTAAFLFTDHPGLESMAAVLLVGLPMCLLASVALVPALVRVLRLGS
jgi:uncharacterized protein